MREFLLEKHEFLWIYPVRGKTAAGMKTQTFLKIPLGGKNHEEFLKKNWRKERYSGSRKNEAGSGYLRVRERNQTVGSKPLVANSRE